MRLGADVDELDRLGATYERCAELVEAARSSVASQLTATAWVGPSADAFRYRWHGQTTRTLLLLSSDLRDAAAQVRAQSSQQRAASAGGPTSGAPTGASGSIQGAGLTARPVATVVTPPAWFTGLSLFAGGLEAFYEHMSSAENLGSMALEAVRHGIEPAMRTTGLYRFVHGSERSVQGFGHLLTFGEQTYGQWLNDTAAGYSGTEGLLRGVAVGGVNAGADMLAVKSFGAVGLAIGGPPGMIVGGVVGSFAVHAIRSEIGDDVNEVVAGGVSLAAEAAVGAGVATVRTARRAVALISTPVADVGGTVRRWFGD